MNQHAIMTWSVAVLLSAASISQAAAVSLFSEDFEGYTSFNQAPYGDPINAGIPKISEGAKGIWYGARFETGDNGTINQDLAIQQYGGGSNNTHTGRTEDDAGLLIKLDTTGLQDIRLDFDWRTFSASTRDRFVVGYRTAPIADFGTCTGEGEAGCFADLRSSLPWYTTQRGTPVLTGNWSELLRNTRSNSWTTESFTLDASANNQSEIWIAFWLDNGEGDYAKIDNINVYGTAIVPLPAAVWLFGSGLLGLAGAVRREQSS